MASRGRKHRGRGRQTSLPSQLRGRLGKAFITAVRSTDIVKFLNPDSLAFHQLPHASPEVFAGHTLWINREHSQQIPSPLSLVGPNDSTRTSVASGELQHTNVVRLEVAARIFP